MARIESSLLAHLLTNHNWNRLSFIARNKLGSLVVEKVQLLGVAAHGGVILLDEEPAYFVLGDLILGFGGDRDICRRDGLYRMIDVVGGIIDSGVRDVVGFRRVRVRSGVGAIDRSLGGVGHGDLPWDDTLDLF
jgi:hypothetical protein